MIFFMVPPSAAFRQRYNCRYYQFMGTGSPVIRRALDTAANNTRAV